MRQFAKEQDQVDRLYQTVSLKNLADIDIPEERREKYRFDNYRQKLELMDPGELGIMPDKEMLMQLQVCETRRVLRSIARIQGFSNNRKKQRQFFAGLAPLAA